MTSGEREKAAATTLREIFEAAGFKTRAIPEPRENPGRFEYWTKEQRRYRIEVHEVDAGPDATIVDGQGKVSLLKTGGEVVTIGAADVAEVKAEDLIGEKK